MVTLVSMLYLKVILYGGPTLFHLSSHTLKFSASGRAEDLDDNTMIVHLQKKPRSPFVRFIIQYCDVKRLRKATENIVGGGGK